MVALQSGDVHAVEKANYLDQVSRTVHLSNPLVKDKSVLLIKQRIKGDARSAMAGQLGYPQSNWTTTGSISQPDSGWDNELVVMTNPLDPEIKTIYKPKRPVLINDPDVHWDGERILFSSLADNNRWNLFEIRADGSRWRQLTPAGFDDIDFFDGCYLPGGKIAMVSNAPYQGVPCIGGG